VDDTFQQPLWVAFYIVAMGALGLHLAHALRSAFQTLGLSARPALRLLSIALCILIGGGFALIPALMFGLG
jgi:succinate dehydrogenase / fumarate reductase cytochrome b subunit